MSLPCPKCGKGMDYIVEIRVILGGNVWYKIPYDAQQDGFDQEQSEWGDADIHDSQFESYVCPHCDAQLDDFLGDSPGTGWILAPEDPETYFGSAMEATL